MDPDASSASPLASTSSALDSRLDRLSLGGPGRPPATTGGGGGRTGFLQDEDISFALAAGDGDDSFDFLEPRRVGAARSPGAGVEETEETVRLPLAPSGVAAGGVSEGSPDGEGRTKGKAPLRETDLFFGGTMATAAAVPASQRFAPPLALGTAAGTAPRTETHANEGAANDDEAELDHLEAYTEDERVQIQRLRTERDGLRGMNGVLVDMREALAGLEGKMQAFESTISTSHALLDLYTRIASQAEHTKDLLLDREWQGVQHDYDLLAAREAAHLAELERQEQAAAEAAQRAEEERVRAEAETEERRRREEEAVRAPAGRGRGRGLRGVASSSHLRGGGTSLRSGTSASSQLLTRGGGTRSVSSSGSPSSSTAAGMGAASGIPTARGSAPVTGVRGVRGLRSRGTTTTSARGGRGRGGASTMEP